MQSNFSASDFSDQTARSLEAEFAQITQQHTRRDRIKSFIKQNLTALLNFLTGEQQHRDGTTQWTVYDPRNDQRQVFDSQQAVRSWLEQRYYR